MPVLRLCQPISYEIFFFYMKMPAWEFSFTDLYNSIIICWKIWMLPTGATWQRITIQAWCQHRQSATFSAQIAATVRKKKKVSSTGKIRNDKKSCMDFYMLFTRQNVIESEYCVKSFENCTLVFLFFFVRHHNFPRTYIRVGFTHISLILFILSFFFLFFVLLSVVHPLIRCQL